MTHDADTSPHVLREYAVLADGERGALVGPRGDIVWMCAPRWDSPAVFGSLMGAPGHYAITPTGRFVWGGHYEDATLVWRNRWATDSGNFECREALAFPGEVDRLVLLRRVLTEDVPASVRVVLDPRAEFGVEGLRELRRGDDGCWSGRVGALHLRWTGAPEATVVDRDGALRLELALQVPPGSHHDLVLELAREEPRCPAPDPDHAWHRTETRWRETTPPRIGAAPRDAAHAACVMRGLTTSSGGMVGAATTSLPERLGGAGNYDYRYTWVRDQCFAGRAAAIAGVHDLLDDAVAFLGARLLDDGPHLAPCYTVDGGAVPGERDLDVPGYPGGGRRVGNRAGAQFQLDAFGELLTLFAAAARHDRLDADGWRAVQVAAAAIEDRWTEPDAGIWELDDRDWTHSRLSCVAGLREIADAVGPAQAGTAGRWSALADRLLAHTAEHATHPDGRWQRAPGDPHHDGALLLPSLRGALPPGDPRSRRTLETYLSDLTRQGYAYRFRPDDRPLGTSEGAFLLCNFAASLACHQQGDALTARHLFDRARSACGPPGLFTEEFDVTERQLRGNLPQAFVHAMLLECAAVLDPLEADR
ncbi:glycoside hydrolase family 15 protein [Actinomycetospora chlora]|uniref:Glycoside hydrolase family 15 protein n=1 Tax=Actinomycetospora chlora TaxID=663608 RepID=A0ABP9B1V5_9PSEU